MEPSFEKLDPWGPISGILYGIRDEYILQNIIALAALDVRYPALDDRTNVSPKTRIQAFRPAIDLAYRALSDEQRGPFAQRVAHQIFKLNGMEEPKARLEQALNDIGWTIGDGVLTTQDALLSEQLFPPGSPYDAYVAIRSILDRVVTSLIVVDNFIGETLLVTLRRIADRHLRIRSLTSLRLLPDFPLEADRFRMQFPMCQLDVRTTNAFHDRFIVVDEAEYFHIGASIKDAGKRAFLASKLEDQPIIDLLRHHIELAWNKAQPVP